jgi:hypothetical protein
MGTLIAGLFSVLLLAGCLPEVTPTVTPSAGHGPDTTRTSVTDHRAHDTAHHRGRGRGV